MNRKYEEAMEHIEVTPKMRDRILKNIANMDFKETKPAGAVPFPYRKSWTVIAACFAVVLIGALVWPGLRNPSYQTPVEEYNGIVEVSSMEELTETVGFRIEEPGKLPFEPTETMYTAYWKELAEITYTADEQTAVFRKGIGTEDVSGDYNLYEAITEISVDELSVTLKGSGKTYALAVWTDGAFAYSLSLSEGIEETEWTEIIQTIK